MSRGKRRKEKYNLDCRGNIDSSYELMNHQSYHFAYRKFVVNKINRKYGRMSDKWKYAYR